MTRFVPFLVVLLSTCGSPRAASAVSCSIGSSGTFNIPADCDISPTSLVSADSTVHIAGTLFYDVNGTLLDDVRPYLRGPPVTSMFQVQANAMLFVEWIRLISFTSSSSPTENGGAIRVEPRSLPRSLQSRSLGVLRFRTIANIHEDEERVEDERFARHDAVKQCVNRDDEKGTCRYCWGSTPHSEGIRI